MPIPFTQYLRPNGEKRWVNIDRSEDIERMALEIRNLGFVFEAEILRTNEVVLTVTHEDDGDLFMEIYPNEADGDKAGEAVDSLVTRAYAELVKK